MNHEFGYQPNPPATAAFCATLPARYGSELDSLVKADDNADALNYRALAKCLGLEGKQIPSRNQKSVGSCVGHGTATPADVVAAVDILCRGDNEEWRFSASADALYALSREVSGNLGRGDGSYGGAAAKAVRECGVIHMTKYGEHDLTTYSEQRCRDWSLRGVPQLVKDAAKATPMRATTPATSIEQLWAALGNGYAANLCSNVGFDSARDSEGRCRRSGKWNHSMGATSRRTTRGGNRLILIHQSWGNDWTSGPYYLDQPLGSFWADYEDVAMMVAQDDTFIYGDYDGFVRRKLPNWGATGVI